MFFDHFWKGTQNLNTTVSTKDYIESISVSISGYYFDPSRVVGSNDTQYRHSNEPLFNFGVIFFLRILNFKNKTHLINHTIFRKGSKDSEDKSKKVEEPKVSLFLWTPYLSTCREGWPVKNLNPLKSI